MAEPTPDPFNGVSVVHQPHRAKVTRTIATGLGLLAIILLAISNVITASAARKASSNTNEAIAVARQIETSSECRFDETSGISDANDALDYWTWVGLEAVATEDQEALLAAIQQGSTAAERLRDRFGERAQIVEDCDSERGK